MVGAKSHTERHLSNEAPAPPMSISKTATQSPHLSSISSYENPRGERNLREQKSRRSSEVLDEYTDSRRGPGRRGHKSQFEDADEDDVDEYNVYLDRSMEKELQGNQRKKGKKHTSKQKRLHESSTATPIALPPFISVANLASTVSVRLEEFIDKMEELGFIDVTHDQILNSEDAGLIAQEYGFEPTNDTAQVQHDLHAEPMPEDKSDMPQRPPIVTIMGHVDHGKTTILDFMRKSSVAATEHGGITQHIGAFIVPLSSGKAVTFLDTPGHAAFLDMRQRGANITDIVVLVVAADDSVMPQTIEAINHAKAANVPIIVAITKCDKLDANPERAKKDLSRNGIDVEDYGGDTQAVCISAKTGKGMSELEEAVVALGEILDNRAPVDRPVEGWVIESTTKQRGKVATVLVRQGTLKLGDIIVAGTTWARVRSLHNEADAPVDEATPGTPVEVCGWRELPNAGDEVLQAPNESKAASVVQHRQNHIEHIKLAADMDAINTSRRLEQQRREKTKALAQAKKDNPDMLVADSEEPAKTGPIQIPLIIKADVDGSAEAITHAVSAVGNNEIQAQILRVGVGPITSSDVDFADVSGAAIISFNNSLSPQVRGQAEKAGVKILDQSIIYRVVEDVTALLSEHLPPIVSQRVLGEAQVAQIFEIRLAQRKTMKVAGCKVRNGLMKRGTKIRVLRNKTIVYDGKCCFVFKASSMRNQAKSHTLTHKQDHSHLSKM